MLAVDAAKPETGLPLYVIARLLRYLREVSGNHGQRVNGLQVWCGGEDGESWCCYFVTWCIDVKFQGVPPIGLERQGSCQHVYMIARGRGTIRASTEKPQAGDLFLYVDTARDHAHHIGVVTDTLGGIAGNTSAADGSNDNGGCVAEHPTITPPNGSHVVYIKVE